MALPTWPTTLPAPGIGSKEDFSFPALRHEFEAGYQYTAPRWTRARRSLTLTWRFLTEAQYAALCSFLVAAQGQEFDWTNPRTSETRRYIIMSDKISCGFEAPGGRTGVSLDIAER